MGASLSSIGFVPDRSKSADDSTIEKPEWMLSAARLKKRNSNGDSSLGDSISSLNLPDRSRSANDSFSDNEKPEWMKSAALLKKKSREAAKNEHRQAKEDKPGEEEKPWLTRNKLKPRISAEDLKASKVQEQLHNRPELKKPPVPISKDDLTTNKVQDKLKNRLPMKKPSLDISRDQLETSKVRAKLASRPTITDKKAPVKKEEMEWMKKKLKPRGTPASGSSDRSAPTASEFTESKEKPKPEWMVRASNLQQASKGAHNSTTESPAEDKTEEERPWLMRNKLKPRVSAADLKSSKVQEKLESKPQIQKHPNPITSEQLQHSKVQEKLSNQPNIPQRKSEFKGEEMEWMKNKLKPDASTTIDRAQLSLEAKDSRPSWMEEGQKKNSTSNIDSKADISTPTASSTDNTQAETKFPPSATTAMASLSTIPTQQETNAPVHAKKVVNSTSVQPKTSAEETELDPNDLASGEDDGRDMLGMLQGACSTKATKAPPLGNSNLIQNERFWSSLADFGSGNKNDSDADDSDTESEVDMEDMSFSQITSADDFLSRSRPDSSNNKSMLGAIASSSNKDSRIANSRSRSSTLDRKNKKKKDKDKKKDKKKKKKKDKDNDDKKKKKRDKKEKE
jgi:hypothetical protein